MYGAITFAACVSYLVGGGIAGWVGITLLAPSAFIVIASGSA